MTDLRPSGTQGSRTAGVLSIVGTPIGNLGDLSARAVKALTEADAIACEDTRRTGRLLAHFGIARTALLVVNDHTEHHRRTEILERLAAGERIALVSDAGMPLVSDPGARVVRAALDAGFAAEVVPGPTAVVSALVLSGLTADRFVFEGFLPRKGEERRTRLAEAAAERRTIVFYESPKRVVRTLHDLVEVCGPDRQVAVARELTKLHEEVLRGSLIEVAERLGGEVRGEIVIVLEGAPDPASPSDQDLRKLLDVELAAGASARDAVSAVVKRTGEAKRRVYAIAIDT